MDAEDLIDQLEPALISALGDEGFDLDNDDESGGIEIATDDWTLVLEDWPNGIGFLAIDDEPATDNQAQLLDSLQSLFGTALAPLREADRYADGAISAALSRTSDPLSNGLAQLLKQAD
jgi:hypothetical protein